jgi:hypothetical protein
MIYGIILIALGLLAVPSLVLAKKPNAKEIFNKVAPYQGAIGILAILLGIWDIIYALQNLDFLRMGTPLGVFVWVLIVAMGLVELALGFIMGYGLISKNLLAKNEVARAKGEALLARLVPLQGKIGIAAIIIGIIYLILYMIL